MKNLSRIWLVACLALPLSLAGCGKPEPEAPPVVQPTPTPAGTPTVSHGDGKDFSAKNIRHQADKAANALGKFLQDQDPKLRAKVERLADKVSDKLGQDKNHWREKLEEKRRELLPQIAQLRQQLGQVGDDKNKDRLKDALSKLQDKSEDTDKKLAELEAAGADAWKQFKARLKEDEAQDHNAPPTDDPSPTPGARSR